MTIIPAGVESFDVHQRDGSTFIARPWPKRVAFERRFLAELIGLTMLDDAKPGCPRVVCDPRSRTLCDPWPRIDIAFVNGRATYRELPSSKEYWCGELVDGSAYKPAPADQAAA
jgi:hypothetical protein